MGELAALVSAVVWAGTSIAMRPVAASALWRSSVLRMLLGAALLGAYAVHTGAFARAFSAPPPAYLWILGSTLSSMVVGDSLLFMAGLRIGVARALTIASAFPLLTTIGAVVFLQEAPTVPLFVGSGLVVAGVGAITSERSPSGLPDRVGLLFACLAACSWACTGLLLAPALTYLDPLAVNVVRFPMGAVLFAAYVATQRPAEAFTRQTMLLTVLAGVGTVLTALLILHGIVEAGVARAVALNATSPVFSALLAVWLLRERWSWQVAVGTALTVAGTILLVQ